MVRIHPPQSWNYLVRKHMRSSPGLSVRGCFVYRKPSGSHLNWRTIHTRLTNVYATFNRRPICGPNQPTQEPLRTAATKVS